MNGKQKFGLCFILVLAGATVMATLWTSQGATPPGQTNTVHTASLMVLPPRPNTFNGQPTSPPPLQWATNTAYAQGAVVVVGVSPTNRYYWCVEAGTSGTTNPVHTAGRAYDVSKADVPRWEYFPAVPRNGFVISLLTTNSVSFDIDTAAVYGRGVIVNSLEHWVHDGGKIQGAVYCIGNVSNNVLAVKEW